MITLRINNVAMPSIFTLRSIYAQSSYRSHQAVTIERLDSDSIGYANTTFSGVVAGSEIRVFYPGGIEAAGIESCGSNQVLSWPVYVVGNSQNNVVIRIINNNYKLKEFIYTAKLGDQSLPIQQELDKWYSNPI